MVRNLVVMVSGSIIRGKRDPNRERTIRAVMITYLMRLKYLGTLRPAERILAKRKRSRKSIIAPKGQKKPQKNRPKTTVKTIILTAVMASGRKNEREAIVTKNPVKGLA